MARLQVTSTDDDIYPPIIRVRLTRPFILVAIYAFTPSCTVSAKKIEGPGPSMFEMRLRFDLSKPTTLTLVVPETFLNAANAVGRFMIMNGEFRLHVALSQQVVTQRVSKTGGRKARDAR